MLKLRVVQARYGDSLILENTVDGQARYILIDGGPNQVYGPYLRAELKQIAAAGGKLDLVVLSHIDNDHVLGLLEFMDELRKEKRAGQPLFIGIDAMWHNGFSKILPTELAPVADQTEKQVAVTPLPDPKAPPAQQPTSYGVEQGHDLQLADVELGIPRNAGFTDGRITLETVSNPQAVAGLKLWIIGPPQKNLERLRQTWVKWLMRENLAFAPGEKPVAPPDDSVNNLSSIMFLVDDGQRRILLTGDALADNVLEGLEYTKLIPTPGGTIHVDIFKLPHHASIRNNTRELFARVQADTYVLCANGKYDNPDYPTLELLVQELDKQGRAVTIFATTLTDSLKQIQEQYPPAAHHYTLVVMPANATSAEL